MSPAQQPEDLPPRLLGHDDFAAACGAHDFAEVFRLVQKYTGYTNSRIARLTDMTPSRISDIRNRRRRVRSSEVIERVADGLRIPGAMLGLAPRCWEKSSCGSQEAEQPDYPPRLPTVAPPAALPVVSSPGQHPDMAAMSNAQDLWISSSGGCAKGVPSRVSDRQVTE